MDWKVVVIFILAVVVLGVAVVGIVGYNKGKSQAVDNYYDSEKKRGLEDEKTLLSSGKGEDWFRAENRHLFAGAQHLESRAFRKALLTFETGQWKEALNLFLEIKVDTLEPELSSAAYYFIASALVNLNEDKRALDFLNRVVQRLKPNAWTTKAVILQGEISRKHQASDESLEVYLHKLYVETPGDKERDEITTQIGYLKLFRDDAKGALEQFQKARGTLARLGEARVHVKRDQYWKAIEIYEDFLKNRKVEGSPFMNDVKVAFLKQTYYYAKQWFDAGNYDQAYFYFRKIVDLFPNDMYGESSLFWIGELFYNRKLYSTAVKYYNLVLANGNRNKDDAAQFKKAMAFYQMKQVGEALRNFQKVIDFHKDSPYAQRSREWMRATERELINR